MSEVPRVVPRGQDCYYWRFWQAAGWVVVETRLALTREDVFGERRPVAGKEADHRVDQVGLFQCLVLERPEKPLAHKDFDRCAAAREVAPVLEQQTPFGVGPRKGAGQDRPPDPVRTPQAQLLRDHSAHEDAEHVGALDAEGVEQFAGVVREA